jgi:hypothetical protein
MGAVTRVKNDRSALKISHRLLFSRSRPARIRSRAEERGMNRECPDGHHRLSFNDAGT